MTNQRLLPILGVAVLVLAFCGLRADGKGKPGGGGDDENATPNFAFVYEETLSRAIFAVTIDGSHTQALTKPTGLSGDRSPTWSPDLDPETDGHQGKIAYLHRPDACCSLVADLFLINGDGSGRQLVCSFETGPFPDDLDISRDTLAWSPNGKEIVFSGSGSGFWAVEIATGNVRKLFGRPFPVEQDMRGPSISPLNMLAFDAYPDIWVIEFELDANGLIQIDESTVTNLTAGSGALYHRHASWSPDGTYLAFLRTLDDGGGIFEQFVVLDMLLGDEIVVLEAPELPEIEAAWSPDGSQIGVHLPTIDNRGVGTWDLFRITDWADPAARQVILVTQPDRQRHLRPSWNPGWEDL